MKQKRIFFYGKCLLACFLAQTIQSTPVPTTACATAVSGSEFPPRNHWRTVTAKAIDAFTQLQDRPLAQVHHKMLTDFTLTAYTLGVRSTGKLPGTPGYGITASGTKACIGRTVAVDPKVIPIGSLLYLPHIGWRIAEDSGGAVKGRHIDVLLDTEQRALHFGIKRHAKVYIYS